MPRPDLEQLFVQHLTVVDRAVAGIARRHGLTRDAADEFGAWARLRIIEDDYAILAKFRGESSLATYLTVVIAMLYREYRVQEWGRWRPSAAAKRAGNVAVRLETLLNRDGLPLAQAAEILRSAGATTLTDRELAELAATFPLRAPLRPVEYTEAPLDAPATESADAAVEAEEQAAESNQAREALDSALSSLPTEDRLIVRMHFIDGMSVADIARGLALPQKPLYRRMDRALSALRATLERSGMSRDRVRSLAGTAK